MVWNSYFVTIDNIEGYPKISLALRIILGLPERVAVWPRR